MIAHLPPPKRLPHSGIRAAIAGLPRVLLWICGAAQTAHAFNCEDHPASSCVDSNQQWLAQGPSLFASIDSASEIAPSTFSFAVAGVYQYQPLVLVAPSPDIAGREVPLVDHAIDNQMLMSAGLGRGFDFRAALRWVPYQTGSGIGAARSRVAQDLPRTAVRDPLVGIGFAFADFRSQTATLNLKLRGDASLPLGDADRFAGEQEPVIAPSINADFSAGRFTLAGEAGLRLRSPATLADVRYGVQFTSALGVAVEALKGVLFASAEASAAPGLSKSPETAAGARSHWVPAEWDVSLTTRWSRCYALLLSGGGALPLSSQRLDTGYQATQLDHFAGLGAPKLRIVLLLRIATSDNP